MKYGLLIRKGLTSEVVDGTIIDPWTKSMFLSDELTKLERFVDLRSFFKRMFELETLPIKEALHQVLIDAEFEQDNNLYILDETPEEPGTDIRIELHESYLELTNTGNAIYYRDLHGTLNELMDLLISAEKIQIS